MTTNLHRRAGFTLLELIVVIGIIVLLGSLTIGVVFRVRDGQIEKNSNESVRKIQIGFDAHWKAVRDKIAADKAIPDIVREVTRSANGSPDPTRAQALYLKLRLRQEFPQSFIEADPARFQAAFVNAQTAPLLAPFPPKPYFAAAIRSTANDPDPDKESAVLLYLILSQGTGGVSFNAENVGGIQTIPVGGVQHKVFVDGFGSPISFRRWADAVDDPSNLGIVAELSQSPYAATGKGLDHQDPERKLAPPLPQDTNPWLPALRLVALDAFVSKAPNTRPMFNININPLDGLNRGPYVFSAGRDKVYNTDDNLYGFRLQQQGRGN